MIARSCRAAIGSVLLLLVASCTSDRPDTRAGARPPSFVWLATPTFGSMDPVMLQNYPLSRNDPWLPADAMNTLGRNVRAYADLPAADGILGDDFLNVSGPKLFDHPYDPRLSPGATANNIGGSVAHLFYVTNFLHDWYHDLGYDEASGNHLNENFGRGGLGHDAPKAETQDHDGRNNANATVPADGSAPRLQMYVFSGASVSSITVDSPAANAFDVTGSVVLGSDDQGVDPAHGCETITTNFTGKTALVHRGLCSFIQKVQNALAAGAAGVIMANVASSADPNTPPFMGGTTAAVTILALADGAAAAIALPLVVSMTDPSFAAGHVASIETSARDQADEAAQSSAIDHVDTKATSWTVTADDGGTEPVPWSRSGPEGIRDRAVALLARRRQRSIR